MSASREVRFLYENQALCPHSPTHTDTSYGTNYIADLMKYVWNACKVLLLFLSFSLTKRQNDQFSIVHLEKNVPINPYTDLVEKYIKYYIAFLFEYKKCLERDNLRGNFGYPYNTTPPVSPIFYSVSTFCILHFPPFSSHLLIFFFFTHCFNYFPLTWSVRKGFLPYLWQQGRPWSHTQHWALGRWDSDLLTTHTHSPWERTLHTMQDHMGWHLGMEWTSRPCGRQAFCSIRGWHGPWFSQ